jgi:hypothetical protein
LIDASAGLTPDDLIAVQALYQAGASAMILISKADLFSAADREQMIAYVKTNLRSELRVEPSVHAVSVFGVDAALCHRWFEGELRPFLAQHHELAITSQKRKIGALREVVIGALERRLQVGSEAAPEKSATLPEKATEALRNGDKILERAQGESFFLARKIAKMHRGIIDIAAERIAAALAEPDEVDAASIFSETLTSLIAEPVAATLRSIEQTRDALAEGDAGRCISFGTGASRRAAQTGWDVNDGCKRNFPKNYGRKAARAFVAGQGNADIARPAKTGGGIQSRIA